MAISFNCPNCPTRLRAKNKDAGVDIICFKCGIVCTVPNQAEVSEDQRADRKAKRKVRADFVERLGLLDIGLLIHYGSVGAFTLSLWLYWLAFSILILGNAIPALRERHADEVADYVFVAAVVVVLLGIVIEIASGICCLKVPFKAAYVLLHVWLGMHALTFGTSIWFWFVEWKLPPACVVFVFLLLSWGMWLVFLLVLGHAVDKGELFSHLSWACMNLGISAAASFVCVLVLTFLGCLMIIADSPFTQVAILLGVSLPAVALWAIVWNFGNEDSPFTVLLYPPGIATTLRYLDGIDSLRMILGRRT